VENLMLTNREEIVQNATDSIAPDRRKRIIRTTKMIIEATDSQLMAYTHSEEVDWDV